MKIAAKYFPGGRMKCLTMSYDDGVHFDRRLVEIFNQNGMRGTFHLNSGAFDNGWNVDSKEVKELYAGHEVSVHTVNHPDLRHVTDAGLVQEIIEDRRQLEALCGYPVRGMSYPFGNYNDHIKAMLPGLGIEYSRTVKDTMQFDLPNNFLEWHPTAHHNHDIANLGKRFLELNCTWCWSVFYVWGHSFEFEGQKTWGVIEDFCKQMRGHDEIWYATNIEIVDYVNAVHSLRVSADENIIYNPTATDVWVGVDGSPVKIPAGETWRG